VTLLVTDQLAVAALVALLSGPPRDGLHANGALQAASGMPRKNIYVFFKYYKIYFYLQ